MCSECPEGADYTEASTSLQEMPIKQGYWRYSMDILRIAAVPDSHGDIPRCFGRGKVFRSKRKQTDFTGQNIVALRTLTRHRPSLYIGILSLRFAR